MTAILGSNEHDRIQKSGFQIVKEIPLNNEVSIVPFTYRWNIHRFSGFCSGDCGDRISSPPFKSGLLGDSEKWCMYLYPNGCREDKKDYVGLFVFLLSADNPKIKATMRLAVVREDGHEHFRPQKSQLCEYVPGRAGSGFPDFIKQNDVEEFLRDDVLTVVCRLKIFIKNTQSTA